MAGFGVIGVWDLPVFIKVLVSWHYWTAVGTLFCEWPISDVQLAGSLVSLYNLMTKVKMFDRCAARTRKCGNRRSDIAQLKGHVFSPTQPQSIFALLRHCFRTTVFIFDVAEMINI
jgi:hypothetical protein